MSLILIPLSPYPTRPYPLFLIVSSFLQPLYEQMAANLNVFNRHHAAFVTGAFFLVPERTA